MKTKIDNLNILPYLQSVGLFQKELLYGINVREITKHSNVNFVFEVTFKKTKRRVFLKQAFDYVKVAPSFPAPINRQYFEYKAIKYLKTIWAERIPDVIFYDKINNILILTDVGEGSKLLAEEFEKGKLHLSIARDLGGIMAGLHSQTYGRDFYPVRSKKYNKFHQVEIIKDFRLKGAFEMLPEEASLLYQSSLHSKTSMIYADWATKNILINKSEVKVVDFENVVRFDPAFDIGYALAHRILEITPINISDIVEFINNFENSYIQGFVTEDIVEILTRSSKYTGVMMLHRLVGIKNTNRLDIYLNRDIDFIEIAKYLIKSKERLGRILAQIKLESFEKSK